MFTDPTGEFWDVVVDLVFIVLDVVGLCVNEGYKNWENWVALGIDIVFAAVPFVTGGGGQVVKVGSKLDNIRNIGKVTVVGQSMDRVRNAGRLLDVSENLYHGYKGYEKIANTGRVIYTSSRTQKAYRAGILIAEPLAKIHNASWLLGKLRLGYTILDIGADVKKVAKGLRSSSYIMERGILTIWEIRNLWKAFIQVLIRG